jgi:hypothetical protein
MPFRLRPSGPRSFLDSFPGTVTENVSDTGRVETLRKLADHDPQASVRKVAASAIKAIEGTAKMPAAGPRLGGARNGEGQGSLGASSGLRPQATNFRRCAAGENPVICNP